MHAYCMPVCYSRCWRGVASVLAKPPSALCCACASSLALAAASRILKRVQDVEEDCARTRAALEALKAKQGVGGRAGAKELDGGAVTVTTSNPLRPGV